MELNFHYDIFCSQWCNVFKIKQEILILLSFHRYRLFAIISHLSGGQHLIKKPDT